MCWRILTHSQVAGLSGLPLCWLESLGVYWGRQCCFWSPTAGVYSLRFEPAVRRSRAMLGFLVIITRWGRPVFAQDLGNYNCIKKGERCFAKPIYTVREFQFPLIQKRTTGALLWDRSTQRRSRTGFWISANRLYLNPTRHEFRFNRINVWKWVILTFISIWNILMPHLEKASSFLRIRLSYYIEYDGVGDTCLNWVFCFTIANSDLVDV